MDPEGTEERMSDGTESGKRRRPGRSIGAGLAIGLALGVGIGTALDAASRKRDEPDDR